jgi:hypothetical protein
MAKRVREGLKDVLLGPAQLYEALRQKAGEHGAFGFGRGAAFFLCAFAMYLVAPAFARARAALLAAARLSGDHGVYRNSGWLIDLMSGPFRASKLFPGGSTFATVSASYFCPNICSKVDLLNQARIVIVNNHSGISILSTGA